MNQMGMIPAPTWGSPSPAQAMQVLWGQRARSRSRESGRDRRQARGLRFRDHCVRGHQGLARACKHPLSCGACILALQGWGGGAFLALLVGPPLGSFLDVHGAWTSPSGCTPPGVHLL